MAMQRSISALPEGHLGIPSHADRNLRPRDALHQYATKLIDMT
jgi:hypothetical protein